MQKNYYLKTESLFGIWVFQNKFVKIMGIQFCDIICFYFIIRILKLYLSIDTFVKLLKLDVLKKAE